MKNTNPAPATYEAQLAAAAAELLPGIGDLADLINFHVGAWHDFGYETPPTPECKPVPPLGERSAGAIKAGHEAIEAIDELTRHLYRLREQLVGELRQDQDLRAARVDAMLAKERLDGDGTRDTDGGSQAPARAQPGCGCPEEDGKIYHRRETCSDPVVAALDWYADGRARQAAVPGQGAGSLPWTMADDKSHWRAELPDGRTAVISRVLGEDGEASLMFRPAVYESASDFVTGPECSSVIAAAQWVVEHAAVSR